jgi:hypothetical protein
MTLSIDVQQKEWKQSLADLLGKPTFDDLEGNEKKQAQKILDAATLTYESADDGKATEAARLAKAKGTFNGLYDKLDTEIKEKRVDDFFDALDKVNVRTAITVPDDAGKDERRVAGQLKGKLLRLQQTDEKNPEIRRFLAEYLSDPQNADIIRSLPRSGQYINGNAEMPEAFTQLASAVVEQGKIDKVLRDRPRGQGNQQRGFCTTATDMLTGFSQAGMSIPGPLAGVAKVLGHVDAWHKLTKIASPNTDLKANIDTAIDTAFKRITSREERSQLLDMVRERVIPAGANTFIDSMKERFSQALDAASERVPEKARNAYDIMKGLGSGKSVDELAASGASAPARTKGSFIGS